MARKKQEEQQAQEQQGARTDILQKSVKCSNTQEEHLAREPAQDTPPAEGSISAEQQAELQQLMQLSLNEIEALPQEKQELVWNELARQLVETPGLVEGIAGLAAGLTETYKTLAQTLTAKTPAIINLSEKARDAFKGTLQSWEGIAQTMKEAVYPLLSEERLTALKTWAELNPYIIAVYDENPELYADAGFRTIVAAAAARARADGKEIPPLQAEEPQPQQMQMQLDLPTESTTKKDGQQAADAEPAEPSPITLARNAGTITTLEGHVATIADKMLQYCFTGRNIKGLPGEHDNFLFDSAGKLNEFSLNGQPLQPLDDIHTGFLMALLQMANLCDIREYNSKDNPSLGVYLPVFFRETGIDPRPREWDKEKKAVKKRQKSDEQTLKQERAKRFIEFMKPLDSRVGAIGGEGYYTLARFISWDEKTDTAYIAIPFEIKLAEMARLRADRHSAISTIFRADILTENQAAVELANRIAVGLIERGVKTPDSSTYQSEKPRKPIKKKTTTTAADGTKTVEELTFAPEIETTVTKTRTDENGITTTVTGTKPKAKTYSYKARFSTLIADCPQLQSELEEIRNGQGAAEKAARDGKKKAEEIAAARRSDHKNDSQRINKKLKDTFTAAIRIIMEKSDIPKYYAAVEIKTAPLDTFKAPTNSTVNTGTLVITHKGKNPNFTG